MKLLPIPCIVKELRSFLGFCSYYRRFIQGFSHIAGPLHNVLNVCIKQSSQARGNQLFKSALTLQCQPPFELLKEKLTSAPSAPTLGYADLTLSSFFFTAGRYQQCRFRCSSVPRTGREDESYSLCQLETQRGWEKRSKLQQHEAWAPRTKVGSQREI